MSPSDQKNNLNRSLIDKEAKHPIRVLQFGEGNFLRAFVDYAIHVLNEKTAFDAGVAVIQPIERGMIDMLNEQDGLYTLFLEGIEDGERIQKKELITSIVKSLNPYESFQDYLDLAHLESLDFVISNTTEAGIAYVESDSPDMKPPSSFPAKLTMFLYERFQHFNGDPKKGLTIIPCELINNNADTLKTIIEKYARNWELGDDFSNWIHDHNDFHNTLVDRIVPGYPRDNIKYYEDQLDYKDNLIATAEVFFLWVIEGDDRLKARLPFHHTNLDVKIVESIQPYRTRKVRILNGAHTSMVPFCLLHGHETVRESIEDDFTGNFIKTAIFEEIIPTLTLPREELIKFATDVLDRFRNPSIKHMLASIALNSVSKFKVRVLPSLLGYMDKTGKPPVHLTFAFACLILFYKGKWYDRELPVNDDEKIKDEFLKIWQSGSLHDVTVSVLENTDYWGEDLTRRRGLTEAVESALYQIETHGIEEGFNQFRTAH